MPRPRGPVRVRISWGRGHKLGKYQVTGGKLCCIFLHLRGPQGHRPLFIEIEAMGLFVIKSIWHPLGRWLSWRGRHAPEDANLSPRAHSSSRDLVNPSDYPPLHDGAYFNHNSRLNGPLPIQLSIHTLDSVVRELVPFFGENCPISVIYSKSPAQSVHHTEVVQATLSTIHSASAHSLHTRSAFILVG
jgi:hypothetical protein